jgi:Protein of unknown function (DUF1585)
LALAVLSASACGDDREHPQPDPAVTFLTPTEHLTRASLALRGVRPSLDDLHAVGADPKALPALIDRYMSTPEFGATIRELHNESLLLEIEDPAYTPPPAGDISGKSLSEISRSIFDEPLRLIEDVVLGDRAYTEVVTADYAMADRIVAIAWGLPHSASDGWERTVWPDARGAAGVVASTAFYLRYRSAGFNYNRDRANAISRALLCHNFLDSKIELDTSVDLDDPDVVANAVQNNPSCLGCHQTLDPLASYFFGFYRGQLPALAAYPVDLYNSALDVDWFFTNGRPPSYFGQPAQGLTGLGQAIAHDPRFARCAAIHFASYLTETQASDLPADWIAQLQTSFVASGYKAKQLARDIVLSDRFRTAAHADPTMAELVVGYQKLRPQQLARMVRDLTGYSWTGYFADQVGPFAIGPVDLLDDDYVGYRVLAGGIDSFYVTQPVHTMNATSSLVVGRLAYDAATYVVAHDADAPADQRTLFTAADVAATDDANVRAELAVLHARIFGELVTPDASALDDELALFRGVLAGGGDARRAWIVTLTAMLSDLRAVYY